MFFLILFNVLLTGAAQAGQCPATIAKMENFLSRARSSATFTLTTQFNGDETAANLCELVASETANCKYSEGDGRRLFQVGKSYYCMSALGESPADRPMVFLSMSGRTTMFTNGAYSLHLDDESLASDLFKVMSKMDAVEKKISWSIVKYENGSDGWAFVKTATRDEAEQDGNYVVTQMAAMSISGPNRVTVDRVTSVKNGKKLGSLFNLSINRSK